MKVRSINNNFSYISKGEVFTVLGLERNNYYLIQTKSGGKREYHKDNFEIVEDLTLEQQLENTQKELEKLQQLIKEKNTPKVGDKYDHCHGDVYQVVSSKMNGKTYYALVKGVGSNSFRIWHHFDTDINQIFSASKHYFTKIN